MSSLRSRYGRWSLTRAKTILGKHFASWKLQRPTPCFKYCIHVKSQFRHLLLPVFSVTPFKIDPNETQNRSIDKSRIYKKKEAKYAKTVAKIQVTANFLNQDLRRNFLPTFIEISMKTPCWCSSSWASTWWLKPTETSLLQKRKCTSRGTARNH